MVDKLNALKDEHVPSSSSDSSTSEDAAPSVTPACAGPLDLLFCSLLTVLRRAVNSDRTVQHGVASRSHSGAVNDRTRYHSDATTHANYIARSLC